MKVVWTPEAEADRAAIHDYLTSHNPAAAVRIDQRFSDDAARLEDFPLLGHPGDIAGTRELTPHRSYRLVYDLADDVVRILVLIHSAREWPPARS